MVGSAASGVLVRFILQKFDELVDLASQLDDAAANTTAPARDSNSVVQLVVHCCGMMRRWSSTVNLGIEVPRDREAEFDAVMPVAEVVVLAAETRAAFLADVERTNLEAAPMTLPPGWDEFWTGSCEGVFLHVLEELCQHLGQAEITRDIVLADGGPDPTRWVTETEPGHSQWYVDRFRAMAAQGDDLVGEARLVDAMLPRRARVLDAGCGTGRIAGELHQRGHMVYGADADPVLIAAAAQDHPGPQYSVADLTGLELADIGAEKPFDAALLAGNVMVFLAPGTETEVLRRMRACVRPDGFIIVGFHTNRHLSLTEFDQHVAQAGLRLEHRFATWDLRPWEAGADFAVSVLRRTGEPGAGGE